MNRYILDANILVRFFTQDSPTLGPAARNLLEAAERGDAELLLEPVIIAEIIFVLIKVYEQDRITVADALLQLIENPGIKAVDLDVLRDALKRFKTVSIDFPNALVAALAAQQNIPVASFDQDLDKFRDIIRFEPKP